MKLHPRVVFFDYGNTLVRDTDDWFGDISRYLVPFGFIMTPEAFARGKAAADGYLGEYRSSHGSRTNLADRFWYHYCKMLLEGALGTEAGELAERMHSVQFFTNTIYPDTINVLTDLQKRGYRLGVISNWEAPTLPSLCDQFGLTRFFDFILPSREAEASKPDPLIFQKAMDALQVRPEHAVHVGDSFSCDVMGARGVGITPIWVNEEGDTSPDASPVLQIANLTELLGMLE
jgi:HAD superfamily hydrolase (TIGR01549 family)